MCVSLYLCCSGSRHQGHQRCACVGVEHWFNHCIQHIRLGTAPDMEMENASVCWCINLPCRTHSDGTYSCTHSHALLHTFTFGSLHPEHSLMALSFSLLPYTLLITMCVRVWELYRIIFMKNIQIYSWVINCGGTLSYSYFMGRKDNNLISFPLCVRSRVCRCVLGLACEVSVCLYCLQSEYSAWGPERIAHH